MNDLRFDLNDVVRLCESGEEAIVIGRAQMQYSEPLYLLRYCNGEGCQVESWWGQSALVSVNVCEIDPEVNQGVHVMATQLSATLKAKLRKAREKFAKAEPAEDNNVVNRNVPDGTYTAKVVGLEFAEFGKHPVIRFTYEITDADKKAHECAIGQMVESRFNLDTDEGPSFIKRDFGKFGYDEVDDLLDDPDASTAIFNELIKLNPMVKVAVSMDDSDQWQNVYLNDVLEMDSEAKEEEAEEEEEEEVVEEKPKTKPVAKGKPSGNKKPPAEEVEEEEDESESESDDGGREEEEEADEEAEEAEEATERELEVGDIVEVNYKGKDVAATVISIDEAQSTVKVQIDKKRVIVPLENIFLLEG